MKKIISVVLSFLMIFACSTFSACSLLGPSESDIEIQEEQLLFVNGGSGLSLELKIKNKSSQTIKTSFNVNIYKNGAVFDSTISGVLTLATGESGYLSSITSVKRDIYSKYTYKITSWNFYNA